MLRSSIRVARLCLVALPILVGCSVDLSRLRVPIHKDAASSPDLLLPFSDTGGGVGDVPDRLDERFSAGEAATPDGAPSISFDGSRDELALGGSGGSVDRADGNGGTDTDGKAGTGGVSGAGGSVDGGEGGGTGGSEETRVDVGTDVTNDIPAATSVEVGADRGQGGVAEDADDSAAAIRDGTGGSGDGADGAADVPEIGAAEVADLGTYGYEIGGGAVDSPAALDTAPDAAAPDAQGILTCPTTVNGSLDPTDGTQIGRLSRFSPGSTCGFVKPYGDSLADIGNPHLYDVHHFVNSSRASVCFNFTLTYPGDQLYAAAYSSFDPADIGSGYLGDVGGTLTSPQTMGINVAAGVSIYVVVSAVAIGTAAAGSYTLSCSAY